jgi:hypothetical protein
MDLLTRKGLEAVVDCYKHYLQEDLIWVAYINENPVGILALVPDLNSLLRQSLRPYG